MWAVATTKVGLPVAFDVTVSPAVNVKSELFVPALSYLINKVSGSVPSVAEIPTTFATTPEVLPVRVVLL